VPNLSNALVAEWKQVPVAMLVESLPRRVEAVIAAKGDQFYINIHDFEMRCTTSRCPRTFGHVVYLNMNALCVILDTTKIRLKCKKVDETFL
jgi:uncharacterized Zn-finger protein